MAILEVVTHTAVAIDYNKVVDGACLFVIAYV